MYFFTDIHGNKRLFDFLRKWCYEQDLEYTIIYGGDAADRGEDGFYIMNELLNDSHIIYLYGNHEDLFVKAADAIIGAYASDDEKYEYIHHCNEEQANKVLEKMNDENFDVKLHIYNGGEPTLKAWLINGADEEFIDNIRELPRTFSYENIDFCHAGGSYRAFKTVADAEYENKMRPYYEENMLIWDRNCIPLGWETGRVCVHGHTPTTYLPAGIYGRDKSLTNIHPCSWYDRMGGREKRGGMKIDMDTGAVFSDRAYVLDCLTLKTYGFQDYIKTGIDSIKEIES
jgi:hypothetical protein